MRFSTSLSALALLAYTTKALAAPAQFPKFPVAGLQQYDGRGDADPNVDTEGDFSLEDVTWKRSTGKIHEVYDLLRDNREFCSSYLNGQLPPYRGTVTKTTHHVKTKTVDIGTAGTVTKTEKVTKTTSVTSTIYETWVVDATKTVYETASESSDVHTTVVYTPQATRTEYAATATATATSTVTVQSQLGRRATEELSGFSAAQLRKGCFLVLYGRTNRPHIKHKTVTETKTVTEGSRETVTVEKVVHKTHDVYEVEVLGTSTHWVETVTSTVGGHGTGVVVTATETKTVQNTGTATITVTVTTTANANGDGSSSGSSTTASSSDDNTTTTAADSDSISSTSSSSSSSSSSTSAASTGSTSSSASTTASSTSSSASSTSTSLRYGLIQVVSGNETSDYTGQYLQDTGSDTNPSLVSDVYSATNWTLVPSTGYIYSDSEGYNDVLCVYDQYCVDCVDYLFTYQDPTDNGFLPVSYTTTTDSSTGYQILTGNTTIGYDSQVMYDGSIAMTTAEYDRTDDYGPIVLRFIEWYESVELS